LDYIFELRKGNGDLGKGEGTGVRNRKGKEIKEGIRVEVESTRIEKFWIDRHVFKQLSDHYGISTELKIIS